MLEVDGYKLDANLYDNQWYYATDKVGQEDRQYPHLAYYEEYDAEDEYKQCVDNAYPHKESCVSHTTHYLYHYLIAGIHDKCSHYYGIIG